MLESRPMMRPGCAAQLAVLLAAPFASGACRQMPVPPPSLAVVTPEAAYNDGSLTLAIEATGEFRPAYRIETSSGVAAADTSGFTVALELARATVGTPAPSRFSATHLEWPDPTQVVATLPAHIPPGAYDVVVTDPRGTRLVRSSAFRSLGTDHDAPTVSIGTPQPGTLAGADTDVSVSFMADDGAGHLGLLGWSVSRVGSSSPLMTGSCAPPVSPSRAGCSFRFPAPTPMSLGDRVSVLAQATDDRGNMGTAVVIVDLAPRPIVTAFGPNAGPTIGGTLLTAEGSDFVAGATQIFLGPTALPTTVVNSTLLSALTGSHDPGPVPVTVRTAGASTSPGRFMFIAAPVVRQVIPGTGVSAGGTPVSIIGDNFRAGATAISFVADDASGADLLCPVHRGPNRIDGYAPAGSGTVAVVATDPIGGAGRLDDGFAYSGTAEPGRTSADGCPDGGSSP
jgi:hypothetical protein